MTDLPRRARVPEMRPTLQAIACVLRGDGQPDWEIVRVTVVTPVGTSDEECSASILTLDRAEELAKMLGQAITRARALQRGIERKRVRR